MVFKVIAPNTGAVFNGTFFQANVGLPGQSTVAGVSNYTAVDTAPSLAVDGNPCVAGPLGMALLFGGALSFLRRGRSKKAGPGPDVHSARAERLGIKSPEALAQTENNMRHTDWPDVTFLGEQESLLDVLAMDRATLEKNGVTPQDILAALKRILNANETSTIKIHNELKIPLIIFEWTVWGAGPRVEEYNVVEVGGVRYAFKTDLLLGSLKCPYSGCSGQGHWRYDLINLETNERISLNILALHLMSHGFFGGMKSDLRVSPEKLIRFLRLGKKYEKRIPVLSWLATKAQRAWWNCYNSLRMIRKLFKVWQCNRRR